MCWGTTSGRKCPIWQQLSRSAQSYRACRSVNSSLCSLNVKVYLQAAPQKKTQSKLSAPSSVAGKRNPISVAGKDEEDDGGGGVCHDEVKEAKMTSAKISLNHRCHIKAGCRVKAQTGRVRQEERGGDGARMERGWCSCRGDQCVTPTLRSCSCLLRRG